MQRQLRSRPAPKIVIDRLGDRLLAGHFADAAAALVAGGVRQFHFADLAVVDVGHRIAHAASASALRSGLADLLELAGRLDDDSAFMDVVTDRLLDVNVFARFHRQNRGESVPVIRRRDRHDVDLFVFEQLADVGLVARGLLSLALDGLHGGTDDGLIGVANRDDFAAVIVVESADVAHAASANPDDGHAQDVVGTGPTFGRFLGSSARPADPKPAMAAEMTAEFWRNSLRLKGLMQSSRIRFGKVVFRWVIRE